MTGMSCVAAASAKPTILAIDTSTERLGVALLHGEVCAYRHLQQFLEEEDEEEDEEGREEAPPLSSRAFSLLASRTASLVSLFNVRPWACRRVITS